MRADFRRGLIAMASGVQVSLEDDFFDKRSGSTCVLAELLVFVPGAHICRSAVKKQVFRTNASLSKDQNTFTLLDGAITHLDGQVWILQTDATLCFQHQPLTAESFKTVIEACSGLGIVGTGFSQYGCATKCFIDSNVKYTEWLKNKHANEIPVICGDISNHRVIHQVAQTISQPAILSGGFSCQPFSALGDRREGLDERSQSLPAMLRLGFFLRSPVLILECTKEALTSPFVQGHLASFMSQTGYVCVQDLLDLHHSWPAARTRWWCILSYPHLRIQKIPQMPKLAFDPVICNLMQIHAELSPKELEQLLLSEYESKHFHSKPGGITTSLIDVSKCLPTATHSWGSQLVGCLCLCRKSGFSLSRLQSRGLYGILISLGRTASTDSGIHHVVRHPHPKEVAILNGLSPNFLNTTKDFPLRLLLSGVGQMASPFQGAWIMGNILKDVSFQLGESSFLDPLKILASMGLQLMDERFSVWEQQVTTNATENLRTQFQEMYKAGELRELGRKSLRLPLNHGVHSFRDSHVHSSDFNVKDTNFPVETVGSVASPVCTEASVGPNASVPGEPSPLPLISAAICHSNAPAPSAGVPTVGSTHIAPPIDLHANHSDDATSSNAEALTSSATTKDLRSPSHDLDSVTSPKITKLSDRLMDFAPGTWTLPSKPSSLQPEPYTANGALMIPGTKRKHDQVTPAPDPIEDFSDEDDVASTRTTQVDSLSQSFNVDTSNIDAIQAALDDLEAPSTSREALDFAQPVDLDVSPTQEWTQPIDVFHYRHPGGISDKEYYSTGIWVCFLNEAPLHILIDEGTRIGQLISAHMDFLTVDESFRPFSEFGLELQPSHILTDKQTIVLLTNEQALQLSCPMTASFVIPPCLTHLCREAALWNQFGWVADDEMKYYLWMFDKPSHPTTPPILFNDRPDDSIVLGQWLMDAIEKAVSTGDTYKVGTACWRSNHWFPLVVKICPEPNAMNFFVSHDQENFLVDLLQQAFGADLDFDVCSFELPQVFPHDCGFQSYATIRSMLIEDPSSVSFSPAEARRWRAGFACYVRSNHLDVHVPHSLRFGGAPEAVVQTDLSKLLEQHGVSPSRSAQVTQHLIANIGLTSLASTLASPRPWADLKTKASTCKPPIQIVLAEELQQQIESRRKDGKQFGRKSNKAKKPVKKAEPAPQIKLRSNQVNIPAGIFQQQDGTKVSQISLHQLHQKQTGIAVLNLSDAEPFLQLREPISVNGIAILLLDYQEVDLPRNHKIITCPASCTDTQEPMIITAALIQLGQQEICRYLPENRITLQQIDTQVVRCLLYRDQCVFPWNEVIAHPFKSIRAIEGMTGIDNASILDVWDRQFLSKQFQRVQAESADLFAASCRLTSEAAKQALAANAQDGLYTEPRAQHGRQPCIDYKVVWLPRKNYAETVLAKQVTQIDTAIARAGDRYGLRVLASQVQAVHDQHRPGIAYLDTSQVKQYRVSPLPFGTTRQSLQQVIDQWKWSARPSHTMGLTVSKDALIWVVTAASPPDYYIWTMSHGDVLIAELPDKGSGAPMREQPVMASHRTLKHLVEQSQTADIPAAKNDDPWTKSGSDPWGSYHKGTTAAAQTNNQIAKIEANLDRKIKAAVAEHTGPKNGDAPMDASSDSRFRQLEQQVTSLTDQVSSLTSGVQSFQQQQGAVNKQFAQQMQHMQTNVDAQSQKFQHLLESKLEDQMSRIEQLLSKPDKRAKTGE